MSVVKCTTDPAHTRIGFRAKHMMFTDIYGKFTKYEMSIEFADEHFESGKFFFKADVASISTSEEKRDAHLRHSDFFDVEKYPYLTFSSTAIKKSVMIGICNGRSYDQRCYSKYRSGC
jgi:Uncharacterized conserved protein